MVKNDESHTFWKKWKFRAYHIDRIVKMGRTSRILRKSVKNALSEKFRNEFLKCRSYCTYCILVCIKYVHYKCVLRMWNHKYAYIYMILDAHLWYTYFMHTDMQYMQYDLHFKNSFLNFLKTSIFEIFLKFGLVLLKIPIIYYW